jgi:C4-dicarboxylate-specific signal transduction histidine kinase
MVLQSAVLLSKIKYSFNLSGAEIKMVKRLFKISVSNIISNALFEVNKKEDGSVSVEVSKTQNSLIIKITDSANSLLTDNISSIFTPFYSTKNIHDGCGLGLSVSKSILEDLNANISVSTLPTTFSIRFSLDDVALVA